MDDAAMRVAKVIVDAHINTWGHIPNAFYLAECIAASLRKAHDGDIEKMGQEGLPSAADVRGVLKGRRL